VIGLISDTHGLLRAEALERLGGSDLIIHAGDVGRPEILDELRRIAPVTAIRGNIDIAPVTAIRGNIDTAAWARSVPETATVETGGVRIYVIHNVHDLAIDPAGEGFHIVVSGHSHKPSRTERNGVLYINPGSAGPRRFRLPISLAMLDPFVRPAAVQFVELHP
jgi:hypothetical protein